MGSISAAFGDNGFFCSIDASGKQDVFCWEKNSSSSAYFSSLPPVAALTGGEGFMCGLLANTSQPYCWNSIDSGKNLVPLMFRSTVYSHIAAGKDHVCAVRGSYFSNIYSGNVDCWGIGGDSGKRSDFSFFDPSLSNLVFEKIVSGEGFSCGGIKDGGIVCWGPESESLSVSAESETFVTLASGKNSLCGILELTGEVKCWGGNGTLSSPPIGTRFVDLTAGAHHFCGIRADDHGIECWGSHDSSVVPKGSGFLAIASSGFITCGVREDDLILDCWGSEQPLPTGYSPPLQLCSPGLCTADPCGEGKFSFNASILSVPDLTSLCVRKNLNICSPCGSNCTEGFFPSSPCSENADRVCTACSLCQNSSCWDVCKLSSSSKREKLHQVKKLVIIIGSSVSGFTLILLAWCLLPRLVTVRNEEQRKKQFKSCMGKPEVEVDINDEQQPALSTSPSVGATQVFRLSELKDATNGFKEFNEVGRGSYGFVYKAVLADGRQVAVKRANAVTIIHTNNRDFEAELEILCNIRHCNIVNLLGYCAEMGERLLVYEFMSHGTLHDHLHGELSPLNWNLRLRISMQAAKGLEYLHKECFPPIVHRDVKASNILLDSEWVARIADVGLLNANNKDLNGDLESDVYNFGIVLLEILSGRKAYDNDYMPPSIVDWAVPLIRKGKAAAIIDRNVALPRNVEPLLKLAEIAELALKEDPCDRPVISDLATWLEQIVKNGLML
ncbi:Protein kinase domain [Macleaya cordata]|uniref:non-specific serine/threonine protein kinase n=1 Tax=Macleaya cordata TaxID=56857 RepID=A0A200QIF0_MACCD|nr:Protein kinase domain [Macleaya cordata]